MRTPDTDSRHQLGAGTGLPGIVAAKLGAHVTLTDHPAYTTVLDNCKASVALNNLECASG